MLATKKEVRITASVLACVLITCVDPLGWHQIMIIHVSDLIIYLGEGDIPLTGLPLLAWYANCMHNVCLGTVISRYWMHIAYKLYIR